MNPIFEKIQKLLRLGQSPNQHEATLALEKAQQIAAENNIELAKVAAFEPEKKESINKNHVESGQRFPVVASWVFSILKNHFNVKVITTGNRDLGRGFYLIGKESDINTSKFVYEFLCDAMEDSWLQCYNKGRNGLKLQEKASFFFGFYTGLNQKLESNKEKIKSSFNDSDKNIYQIVLSDTKQQIEKYVANTFPSLRTTQAKRVVKTDASFGAGHREGQKCEIHKGSLT